MIEKVCLITGATRGLGKHLTYRFWKAGYSLCLISRSEVALADIVRSLPCAEGQQAFFYACDLACAEMVEDTVVKIKKSLPRLDVLVNNAAIQGPIGPTWENDIKAWRNTLQVNLLTPVILCHAFVPLMKRSEGGAIINLSGGGAASPRAYFGAYASAKAGLVRFSETLAVETRTLGIRVNCIAPGVMKTAMLNEVLEKGADFAGEHEYAIASKVFVEGGSSMDRVADLALFLASKEGCGVTGKLISAVWDNWEHWSDHLEELNSSDVYTLRRIAGRDRNMMWGDK